MSTIEPTEPSLWNVAFLVRDFPEDMRTLGPYHFNGTFDDESLRATASLAPGETAIKHFVGHYPASRFVWFGLRVEAAGLMNAIDQAHHRLDGMIDGTSFWSDNQYPEIADLVWIGQAEETDLHLVTFGRQHWANFLNSTPTSRDAWQLRNDELRKKVTKFYTLALEQHSQSGTDLARQIRHSIRMFRHGKHSRSWGVEFICKFCALEGLVCGSLQTNKAAALKQRLSVLLRDSTGGISKIVGKLWDHRSKAIHTAQAFDAGSLGEGAALGVNLEKIEHLFVAALVFALDRIYDADDVDKLWQGVAGYTLPEFARAERPKDLPRYAIRTMHMPLNIRMAGGGDLFRRHLEMSKAEYDAFNQFPGSAA